ncbi:MAG: hypothetical protein J6386_16255 [Candidatus Synoicihabitans palmerolidicus]|nr:hypothetical protein [Candidatus Synoicihabitans palmerolidicus]
MRNLAQSGYTAGFQPHSGRYSPWTFPGAADFHPEVLAHRGRGHFPSTDEWLTDVNASTVLGFFGYSESFRGADGLMDFRAELLAWIRHLRARVFDGVAPPQIVLVPPTPFEDRSVDGLSDGRSENLQLRAYADAMVAVAAETGVAVIDVWDAFAALAPTDGPFTVNGAQLNSKGVERLGSLLAESLLGPSDFDEFSSARFSSIEQAISDKDWLCDNLYRMRNGVHAFGRRWQPFGDFNYPE